MTIAPLRAGPGAGLLVDRLLVQCGAGDVDAVLPLLRDGSGLVVTGKDALQAASRVRKDSPVPVLTDRGRYAGAGRVPARVGLSASWVDAQLDVGAAVALTDSGYIGATDVRGLVAVLSGTARLGPGAVAVLPLHRRWLTADSSLLVEEINAHGVPVALVVEDAADPFGTLAAVQGLKRVLAAAVVPVMLLRSDTSALGAVAHGATAGALGVRSSLRHLYEPPKPGKGFKPRNPLPAALWRPGMYLVKVDRLAAAHAATPDDPAWVCECSICRGRTLDWLYLDAAGDEVLAHTVEVALDARDALVALPEGPRRRLSWVATCNSAEFQFDSAAATAVRWTVPPALKWWQKV